MMPSSRASLTLHSEAFGPAGTRKVVLKAGAAGRSRIQVRAQGERLALPALPFGQEPTLTVQLRSSAGPCWEATYTAPARRNRVGQFKDRAE